MENSLIEQAHNYALATLKDEHKITDRDEQLVFNAAVDFLVTVYLGRTAMQAAKELRTQVFKVYTSASWANVPIPVRDIHGEPTGEYTYFARFEDWLNTVAVQAELDDAYKSTLASNVRALAPLLNAERLITEEGEVITVDTITELSRGNFDTLATAANALSKNSEDIPRLAQAVVDARDLTREDLKKKYYAEGLIGRRLEPIPVYLTTIAGQIAYVVIPQNGTQEKRFTLLMGNNADIQPIDSVEELES
jgi:hypothetical protein